MRVIRGVSAPRCHPPEAVPDPLPRGSLTPQFVRTHVAARRVPGDLLLPDNGGHAEVSDLISGCEGARNRVATLTKRHMKPRERLAPGPAAGHQRDYALCKRRRERFVFALRAA
jgi:hypothetical protein